VGEGDEIAYRIEGDHVILTKAKREPINDSSLPSMSGRPRPTGAPMVSLRRGMSSKSRSRTRIGRCNSTAPLVIAANEVEAAHDLLWLVMITRAENRGWPTALARFPRNRRSERQG
jgi:hypothetical protein